MKKLWMMAGLLLSNPANFIGRVQRRFQAPSDPLMRTVRRLYCALIPNKAASLKGNPDRFLFVYDTLSSPVTFDFLHYLYVADWKRRQAGKRHLDVLIVSRPNLSHTVDGSWVAAIGHDGLNWRISNLLVPLCRLFASVNSIHIVDQEEAFEIVKGYGDVHPEGYSYASPKSAVARLDATGLSYSRAITIPATAREIVEAYFPAADDRRIVTITLRSYDFISVRNSDIPSWVEFAHELDPGTYRVVFIPDASVQGVSTFGSLGAFEIFDAACWNVALRAALYARAWVNMGVACGPLVLAGLMENAITIMIDRSLDYPADYLDAIRSNTGVIPGERPNFYSSSCHFHLGKDNKETIWKLFKEYSK
jgi:hypothetical protein